jgi:hypothetical protein
VAIQIITLGIEDMQSIVADAYKEGYIKAQREWEIEKAAKKDEVKFSEIIRGVKELRQYLIHKSYWVGSVSTLSKVAPQLLLDGDRQGHSLIFRRTSIDYVFSIGFHFVQPPKKKNNNQNV